MWTLLIAILTVSYVIQRRKLRALPPSSCAMLLGILAGVLRACIVQHVFVA